MKSKRELVVNYEGSQFHASRPSLAAIATTARLATGSAHHQPNEAASAMPSNVLRLKTPQIMVSAASEFISRARLRYSLSPKRDAARHFSFAKVAIASSDARHTITPAAFSWACWWRANATTTDVIT